MSTHSSIAVQYEDESVEAVYCHFDGYPEGVGNTLVTNFDDLQSAKLLVGLGDLSVVAKATSIKDVCAYSRDRGEDFEGVAPKKFNTLKEYKKGINERIDGEYNYIFTGGHWYILKGARLVPVEKELGNKDAELQTRLEEEES